MIKLIIHEAVRDKRKPGNSEVSSQMELHDFPGLFFLRKNFPDLESISEIVFVIKDSGKKITTISGHVFR